MRLLNLSHLKFHTRGNTEILRPGKVTEFLDRLKDLADEENRKISDYIAERIEIVKRETVLLRSQRKRL